MLDVLFYSDHLYGLPERKTHALLGVTDWDGDEPYRLFSIDKFPADEWSIQGLYSGIPYI